MLYKMLHDLIITFRPCSYWYIHIWVEKVTKLNAELASINDRVQQASANAARLEDNLKKMESKYEQQLKDEQERAELQKKFVEKMQEHDKVSASGMFFCSEIW